MSDYQNHSRPLSDIRVADLTMGWSGPSLTLALADFGAKVVKVESCTRTDWWRTSRALFVGGMPEAIDQIWEWSPLYNAINQNKYGITLNLETDDGLGLARKLIDSADVVVENFTPRVMGNFGFSYASLAATNPGLIMVSMPAFGLEGPWADYKATAFATESVAGVFGMSGHPDEPILASSSYADPNAGIIGAMAVVLALRALGRTGKGQHIEVSQSEALTPMLTEALLDVQLDGTRPRRQGNRSPTATPQGIFPTAGDDRWIAISVQSDQEWLALAAVLGIDGTGLEGEADRRDDESRVESLVASATRDRDARQLSVELQLRGVTAVPVQNGQDVLNDPHFAATGFFQVVDRAIVGPFPYPRPPIQLSATPALRTMPAPTLGEHNTEILTGDLGLSVEEVRQLELDGVIGTEPRF